MSVQAIAWVFDHSEATGTDRLVLLSLANHAGRAPESGAWESWPGIETIRREARLARTRTVQESLQRMEGAGLIERVINGAPDARIRGNRRPNLYRILIADGVTPDSAPSDASRGDAKQHPSGVTGDGIPEGSRGDASRHLGVPPRASRGAASRHLGVPRDGTQTVIEPSVEPSEEPIGAASTFSTSSAAKEKPSSKRYEIDDEFRAEMRAVFPDIDEDAEFRKATSHPRFSEVRDKRRFYRAWLSRTDDRLRYWQQQGGRNGKPRNSNSSGRNEKPSFDAREAAEYFRDTLG